MRQEQLVILGSKISESYNYEGLDLLGIVEKIISQGSSGDIRMLACGISLQQAENDPYVFLSGFEADSMEMFLKKVYPQANDFIITKEKGSSSTRENLKNIPDFASNVKIITSLFHVPRTYWSARKEGMTNFSVEAAEEIIFNMINTCEEQKRKPGLITSLEARIKRDRDFCEKEMRKLQEISSSLSYYINAYNNFLAGNASLNELFRAFSPPTRR